MFDEILLWIQFSANLARLRRRDVARFKRGVGCGSKEWGAEGFVVELFVFFGVERRGILQNLVDHFEAGREVEGEELSHVEELIGRRSGGVVSVGGAGETLELKFFVVGLAEDAAVKG